jgi:hypothetical protein
VGQQHTHLDYGSPNKQDTCAAHGLPLGEEEVKLTKHNLGRPLEPAFCPDQALANFRRAPSWPRPSVADAACPRSACVGFTDSLTSTSYPLLSSCLVFELKAS